MILKRENRINRRKTYRHGERRDETRGEGSVKGNTHLLLQEGKRNMYCNESSQAVPARPSGKGGLETR